MTTDTNYWCCTTDIHSKTTHRIWFAPTTPILLNTTVPIDAHSLLATRNDTISVMDTFDTAVGDFWTYVSASVVLNQPANEN